MQDQHLHNLNLLIAGRNYPVSVTETELPVVQALAKQINEGFDDLKRRYAGKLSNQDILAMMLLTYAQQLHNLQEQNLDLQLLNESIDHLDNLLDHALQNKK